VGRAITATRFTEGEITDFRQPRCELVDVLASQSEHEILTLLNVSFNTATVSKRYLDC
jgi:hypothetical protein